MTRKQNADTFRLVEINRLLPADLTEVQVKNRKLTLYDMMATLVGFGGETLHLSE